MLSRWHTLRKDRLSGWTREPQSIFKHTDSKHKNNTWHQWFGSKFSRHDSIQARMWVIVYIGVFSTSGVGNGADMFRDFTVLLGWSCRNHSISAWLSEWTWVVVALDAMWSTSDATEGSTRKCIMIKVGEAKKRKRAKIGGIYTFADIEGEYEICVIGLWGMDALGATNHQ